MADMADTGNNVYAPPTVTAPAPALAQSEDPFEATKQTTLVIVSAACLAVNGLVFAFTALQLVMYVRLLRPGQLMAYSMVITGICFVAVAVKVYRQRLWAVRAGIGLSAVGALAAVAWFVVSVGSGLITVYALMLPPLGVAGVVLGVMAMPQIRRACAARLRLAQEGLLADF